MSDCKNPSDVIWGGGGGGGTHPPGVEGPLGAKPGGGDVAEVADGVPGRLDVDGARPGGGRTGTVPDGVVAGERVLPISLAMSICIEAISAALGLGRPSIGPG